MSQTDLLHKALDVLVGYEAWEADLILSNPAWDTEDGLPRFTEALYDRWMELQEQRNAVVREARAQGLIPPAEQKGVRT